ncbi:MAG: hypothetical protein V4487_07775 [Chlamydiota bacterium]
MSSSSIKNFNSQVSYDYPTTDLVRFKGDKLVVGKCEIDKNYIRGYQKASYGDKDLSIIFAQKFGGGFVSLNINNSSVSALRTSLTDRKFKNLKNVPKINIDISVNEYLPDGPLKMYYFTEHRFSSDNRADVRDYHFSDLINPVARIEKLVEDIKNIVRYHVLPADIDSKITTIIAFANVIINNDQAPTSQNKDSLLSYIEQQLNSTFNAAGTEIIEELKAVLKAFATFERSPSSGYSYQR